MLVGINYPWFDYGWDFGLGPPAWRGSRTVPRWFDYVDDDLSHLYDLGVRILRWFVLGDGLTYGSGPQAPVLDSSAGLWRFDPPPIESSVLEHFSELLTRITAFNASRPEPLQLLPVLVDFHFCDPGVAISKADSEWVKQGRADAIADGARQRMFLDLVLEPLLQVSRQHSNAVYAWELINEPDWVTNGWHPDHRNDHPIDLDAMENFLVDGIQRVRQAGFKATIGFALVETLAGSRITADLNQFHHYPGGTRILPPQLFDPGVPAIIGEFATATDDIWPDLAMDGQRVLNRLLRIRSRGYPVAIPWSFRAHDRHTAWSRAVESDVRRFTRRAVL